MSINRNGTQNQARDWDISRSILTTQRNIDQEVSRGAESQVADTHSQ